MIFRESLICSSLCLALLCSGAFAEEKAEAGMAPLPLELPQPGFGGTPLNYTSPHLEPPSFRMRRPFQAPNGTKNVALGKETTASAKPSIGTLGQLVDGEKDYHAACQVELPSGPQWVQIDLGAPHEVYAIVVWHYYAADRVYFDFIVQTSLEERFEAGTSTHYNNDHDDSSGLGAGKDKEYVEDFQGRLVDTKGARSRYVRLRSNGNTSNDMNHYLEVEVWGKPATE